MSRDGSGTYNRPAGQPVVAGTTISDTVFNTLTADLATALTNSIAKDGQTPTTARIPFAQGIQVSTDLTTDSTTFAVANATATTLNIGGAATTLSVGAATGTLTVNNATLAGKTINASVQLIGKGTATNDDAAAGYLGEIASATAVSVNAGTSGQYADMASIALTAGDWDVVGQILIDPNGATVTGWSSGVLPVSGNDSTGLAYGDNFMLPALPVGAGYSLSFVKLRVSLSGSATYYLKTNAAYSGGPPQFYGKIEARRAR